MTSRARATPVDGTDLRGVGEHGEELGGYNPSFPVEAVRSCPVQDHGRLVCRSGDTWWQYAPGWTRLVAPGEHQVLMLQPYQGRQQVYSQPMEGGRLHRDGRPIREVEPLHGVVVHRRLSRLAGFTDAGEVQVHGIVLGSLVRLPVAQASR